MSVDWLGWSPLVGQLRSYSKELWVSDLSAGLTVAAMLIPQGMAYAMLAGLPPVVGLYASIFPLLVYAFVGTSRQLAVGPVAMDSLLVATAVGAVAASGSSDYLAAAVVLAAMVGALQVLMGMFRLGFIVNFLAEPVIAGFMSASAVIIGLGQLKHLLGVDFAQGSRLQDLSFSLLSRIDETNLPTLFVGLVSMFILLGVRRLNRRWPAAFFALLVSTLLVALLGLNAQGVQVLGHVPNRVPVPQLTRVGLETARQLLPAALTIALVGFLEAVSVAKSFASKHRYEIRPNQELTALGLANIAGYLFGGYPVTGGLSRTAVNDSAGARTAMASIFSAVFVLAALAFLTPLLGYLPNAALAAIVMLAVAGLFDYRALARFWRVKRSDAGLFVVAFLATLLIGIQQGITIGVIASLLVFIYRSTHPHTAELGRVPGSTAFRNFKNFPEATPIPGVLILRIDASFYFANVAFLKDRIERLLREDATDSRALLIDASSINDLDSSADAALGEIMRRLRAAGRELYLANVKGPVRRVMQASGLWQELGEDHIFLDIEQAVQRLCPEQADEASSCRL